MRGSAYVVLAMAALLIVGLLVTDCVGGKDKLELGRSTERRYVPERDWVTCSADSKTGSSSCTNHHDPEEWNVLVESASGRGWIDSRSLYESGLGPCAVEWRIGRLTGWTWGPLSCTPIDPSKLPLEG